MVKGECPRYNAAMSASQLPVIAVVPNYCMAPSLTQLVPALLKQAYDHIYIIDDASTDDSITVLQQCTSSRLTVIQLSVNRGAGPARNTILEYLKKPAIIHFLDADVELLTNDMVRVIRTLQLDERTGFVGGRIATSKSPASPWNYGPPSSLFSAISSPLYMLVRTLRLRPLLRLFPHRVNPYSSRPRSGMYWVGEGNMVITSDRLKELGGFTNKYREHDIKPLAYEAYRRGYTNWYEPRLAVRHMALKVRPGGRQLRIWLTDIRMSIDTNTLLYWFLPFLRRRK